MFKHHLIMLGLVIMGCSKSDHNTYSSNEKNKLHFFIQGFWVSESDSTDVWEFISEEEVVIGLTDKTSYKYLISDTKPTKCSYQENKDDIDKYLIVSSTDSLVHGLCYEIFFDDINTMALRLVNDSRLTYGVWYRKNKISPSDLDLNVIYSLIQGTWQELKDPNEKLSFTDSILIMVNEEKQQSVRLRYGIKQLSTTDSGHQQEIVFLRSENETLEYEMELVDISSESLILRNFDTKDLRYYRK